MNKYMNEFVNEQVHSKYMENKKLYNYTLIFYNNNKKLNQFKSIVKIWRNLQGFVY